MWELVHDTLIHQMICIPKLALEIQDLLLPATALLPRLDNTHPIWMWDGVSGGLQPQPWHHIIIWAPPYPNFPKFGHHFHRYNSVRVHPYAHPQHMKVLKHLTYIQYGWGMQSGVANSLNHDTTTSFGLRHSPILRNLAPTCTGIAV